MNNQVISKVFGWMFIGLLITFLTGYVVVSNPVMVNNIFGSPMFILFAIIEIVLVIVLSIRIKKMKPSTAKVCFILYSFVSGLTFSSIFIQFELTSIIFIFLITAVLFAIFAAVGYFTNMDLTKIGTYLFMGLIGIILCSIISIFLNNETFNFTISAVTVIIFILYTAYDIQKIKLMIDNGSIPEDNLAIYGALQLYLDFINIFLRLLNMFGRDNG